MARIVDDAKLSVLIIDITKKRLISFANNVLAQPVTNVE
jgi:hypothetical protein